MQDIKVWIVYFVLDVFEFRASFSVFFVYVEKKRKTGDQRISGHKETRLILKGYHNLKSRGFKRR